ncbi:hypothetical protein M3650_26570 [Paenibacillus sp. MER TA 81-3]|uniref:hypothetical protein n=1 Tax=Paenibacillus sp. MER TA 81-3 TaxID=2939573 RepID=UPI00203D5A36|nr:hypothetical protein [Paenibacillus sp. MER TA 81-3]MCM3342092.1 hypothetical protein [Paenibacillus sp. MER TA 81-3]
MSIWDEHIGQACTVSDQADIVIAQFDGSRRLFVGALSSRLAPSRWHDMQHLGRSCPSPLPSGR